MPITNYKIGIVLSSAGLNTAQLVNLRARLRDISNIATGYIHVFAPSFFPRLNTHRLLSFMEALPYVKLHVLDYIVTVNDCVEIFHSVDEVWCLPPSARGYCRALRVCERAKLIYPNEVHKYKMIQPWVETIQEKPRVKPLKG